VKFIAKRVDEGPKMFIRPTNLEDLAIWNFTKNKSSSHYFNFCKISDLEDPWYVKIDTKEPESRTFIFDDACCATITVYTPGEVESSFIAQINEMFASITGAIGDSFEKITIAREHLEFWKQVLAKYKSWIVNNVAIAQYTPNRCLYYNGLYTFLLKDKLIMEVCKKRNGAIYILRVNGEPAKLCAKVGGSKNGPHFYELKVSDWKVWNATVDKYGGEIMNGINIRDMSDPSLVSKTMIEGTPYFEFAFPELYTVGVSFRYNSDPIITAMDGHVALAEGARLRKVGPDDLNVWRLAAKYNAGMRLNHVVAVDKLSQPTHVKVSALKADSNSFLGVNYKFFFGKSNIIIEVEKDSNEDIDITGYNGFSVVKRPIWSKPKKDNFTGFRKSTEEIKRVWKIAKKPYTGLLVNDIPLHRLKLPTLYRITSSANGKVFTLVFDLNCKIDVAFQDATYSIIKVNGKHPIVNGPDELYFGEDILNIWTLTLRKYKNYELNGIDTSELSFPTVVTPSPCGDGIHYHITDFSGHTLDVVNKSGDHVQAIKLNDQPITKMEKVNIFADDDIDVFMNMLNADGDAYLTIFEVRHFINKYPDNRFDTDYLDFKINLTELLCQFNQKIPTSLFRDLLADMRYSKIVNYFVYEHVNDK